MRTQKIALRKVKLFVVILKFHYILIYFLKICTIYPQYLDFLPMCPPPPDTFNCRHIEVWSCDLLQAKHVLCCCYKGYYSSPLGPLAMDEAMKQ